MSGIVRNLFNATTSIGSQVFKQKNIPTDAIDGLTNISQVLYPQKKITERNKLDPKNADTSLNPLEKILSSSLGSTDNIPIDQPNTPEYMDVDKEPSDENLTDITQQYIGEDPEPTDVFQPNTEETSQQNVTDYDPNRLPISDDPDIPYNYSVKMVAQQLLRDNRIRSMQIYNAIPLKYDRIKPYPIYGGTIVEYDGKTLLDDKGNNIMDADNLLIHTTNSSPCIFFIARHKLSTYIGTLSSVDDIGKTEAFIDIEEIAELIKQNDGTYIRNILTPANPLDEIFYVTGLYCNPDQVTKDIIYEISYNLFRFLNETYNGDKLILLDELSIKKDNHYIGYDYKTFPNSPFLFTQDSLKAGEKDKKESYMTELQLSVQKQGDEIKEQAAFRTKMTEEVVTQGEFRGRMDKEVETQDEYRRDATRSRGTIKNTISTLSENVRENHIVDTREHDKTRNNMDDRFETSTTKMYDYLGDRVVQPLVDTVVEKFRENAQVQNDLINRELIERINNIINESVIKNFGDNLTGRMIDEFSRIIHEMMEKYSAESNAVIIEKIQDMIENNNTKLLDSIGSSKGNMTIQRGGSKYEHGYRKYLLSYKRLKANQIQ